MKQIRSLFGITWRSLLVAVGYFLGMMLAGIVSVMLGMQVPDSASNSDAMVWFFIASIVLGLILCPIAMRLPLTRWQHFMLWLGVIFFNMGSVAIEGKYFVPDLVPLPLPVLFTQQLIASASAALLIVLTCAKQGKSVSWVKTLRTHSWFAWLWRFLVCAVSYLVSYFIFGSINYSLVTRPYYETHAGGLVAPPSEVVFMAEFVRAPLIVLSILLYLLSERGTRRELILKAGWLLFAVGGIVPIVLQIGSLPPLLLAASTVEIFCQNFLTGAISGWLLGVEKNQTEGSPLLDISLEKNQAQI